MTRPRTVTWEQICARRLERHGLATPVPATQLADVVGVICGAHAQVMSAAEVSVAIRVTGIARDDVRRALWEERSIVKTIGPRGTVHLLRAADLPTWNAGLGAAMAPPNAAPDVRLSDDQLEAVIEAIDGALTESDRTLEELDAEVVRRAGPWAGDRVMPAFQQLWPRWRQAIQRAAYRGVLCFGPNQGNRVTYASPRRWLPGYEPADPAEAGIAVLRAYLHAYGPAAAEHVARWTNGTPAWTRDVFRRAADELESVELDGERLWQLAGDEAPENGARGVVRLLPYFDAYAVGSHPRARLFPGRAGGRALASTQAGNYPVLLVGDAVVGVWHQKRSGKRIALRVEAFRDLTAAERGAVEQQAERIADIQGATATLEYGEITVGPHA
ncbi:MAG TPA: winged helix DNA-binding domain-containing protein [Candidatus Limnocylindrales bacterium]|nr:winged helix DNA-binding domain-containing protein [Candidatus Limnocylindrales bacterium]